MDMYVVTDRQRDILDFIVAFTRARGFPPSIQEIAEGLGMKARSNIHRHLHVMKRLGLIKMSNHKFRTVKVAPEYIAGT